MTSSFFEKFKESSISVVPVMMIVTALHFSIAPLGEGLWLQFLVGGFWLMIGLSLFLVGADIGMVPFGQRVGSSLANLRRLPLILSASFVIGFAITIAEPDVQVLATQVNSVMPGINRQHLLVMIALGVGFFLMVGLLRFVLQLSMGMLLIIFYALVFAASSFVDLGFVGVAFDAGGATTGPITVPFIMAMSIGVAGTIKKKEGDDSSFGMVGLASIGPIAAVTFMGFMTPGGPAAAALEETGPAAGPLFSLWSHYFHLAPEIVEEIALALAPLLLLFVFFQLTLLRLPFQQVKRMLLGFIYSFVGLVVFMIGVKGGFTIAGRALGLALGASGGAALIPVGFILGAVVVCAEPAVWVLTEQVERVSSGYIRRSIMLAALSISIALAVTLGMVRVVTGLTIWWTLIPGYGLALLLTRVCPPLFTAIAFDSGGVASGPMSTTFILALTLGASTALGGNPVTDAFGMVAMIAMAPLITIQILGLIFKYKEYKQRSKRGPSS